MAYDNPVVAWFKRQARKIRKLAGVSKFMLVASTINLMAHISLSVYDLIRPIDLSCLAISTQQDCSMYVSNKAIIFLAFTVVQYSNIFDGLLNENLYELIGSLGTSLMVTAFASVRFMAPYDAGVADYLLLVESCIYQLVFIIIAYPLWREYNKRLHRKVGADPNTQGLYKLYLAALALLKYDFMFSLLCTIASGNGIFNPPGLVAFDIAAGCLAFCFSMLGWQAMKREHKVLMGLFFAAFPLSPIYIIYWLAYTNLSNTAYGVWVLGIFFVICGAFTMLLHIILLVLAIHQARNFGKGLKETLKAEKMRDRKRASVVGADMEDFDENEDFDIDLDGDDGTAGLSLDDVISNTYASKVPYTKMQDK